MKFSQLIQKALDIAFRAHEGQLDKAGKPYITHPIRIALMLNGEKLQAVALLHDVVEDTAVTLVELSKSFPVDIIDAVDAITHRKLVETYDAYLVRVKSNPLALPVKIADLKDNLSPAREYPNRKTEQYEAALRFLTQ